MNRPTKTVEGSKYTAVVSIRPGQCGGLDTWVFSVRLYTRPVTEETTEYLLTFFDTPELSAFDKVLTAVQAVESSDIDDMLTADPIFCKVFL